MPLQVVEREAIVVNNVDPEKIGRVQVFIYGVHDICGIKTPYETLPWAFSTQGTNVVSIPKLWTPLKVRNRIPFGRNMLSAFSEQDALEWHSPSPYLNLTPDRDPRNFMTWDSEKQDFLNETPEDYETINSKIQELEQQKAEKEKEFGELSIQLFELTGQENELTDDRKIALEDLEKLTDQLERLEYQHEVRLERITENIAAGSRIAKFYYERGLLKEEEKGFNLIEYTNYYNEDKLRELDYEILTYTNLSSELITEINETNTFITEQSVNVPELLTNRQKQETLQKEITALSQEILEIDKELTQLKSQDTGSPICLTSIEQARALDERIGRLDEASGKVYNKNEEVIGNWTGSRFYLPGYALQYGLTIQERVQSISPPPVVQDNQTDTVPTAVVQDNQTNAAIVSTPPTAGNFTTTVAGTTTNGVAFTTQNNPPKAESYLQPNNNNGSKSGQLTTVIDPSDSKAIDKSNKDKGHVCDLSYETRMKILMKRESVLRAVTWLRDQIAAKFSIDAESATAQWVKAAAKQLTAMLKKIQDFLNFVNKVVLEIGKIVAQIKQLIRWILSLPAAILALLQDCLQHFYKSLSDSLFSSVNIGGVEGTNVSFTEVNDLVNQAQSTLRTATDTVKNTVIVYTEIKTIEETFEKV